jgi:hypothetical protein
MTVGTLRPLFAVAVELLWSFAAIALFVQLVSQVGGDAPSLLTVAAVGGGAFVLSRLLRDSDLGDTALAVTGVAATLVALALAYVATYGATAPWSSGAAFGGAVALVPLWVRGIQRGRHASLEPDEVMTSASIGFAPVVVAALARPPVMGGMAWGELLVAYAVVALLTFAVFRAPDPAASAWSAFRGWTAGLVALLAVAVAVGAVAAAVDPDSLGAAAPAAEPLRGVATFVGRYILGPLIAIVVLPFQLLIWLIGWLLPDAAERPMPEQPDVPPLDAEPEELETPAWFRVLLIGAGVLGAAVLVTVGVLLLASLFRRFARSDGDAAGRETRIEVVPAQALGGGGSLLGAIRRRFRRDSRRPSDVAIERLYFELLDDAARRGMVRPHWLTPNEFAPALDQRYGSDVPSRISAAFSESKYGAHEIEMTITERLREQWRRTAADPST